MTTLHAIVRSLSEQAETGDLRPLMGRVDQMRHVRKVLDSRENRVVLLRGPSGSGRSAIAAGLAVEWAGSTTRKVYSLAADRLQASTVLVHDDVSVAIEECSETNRGVLYIDDLAPLLMPAEQMQDEELRMVDAITSRAISCICGLRSDIPKNSLFRDFEWDAHIELPPLSLEATEQLLLENRYLFEHKYSVRLDPSAIQTAVQLSERFLPDQGLPGTAIDVVDAACERYCAKIATKDSPNPWADKRSINKLGEMVSRHDVLKAVETLTDEPFNKVDEAAWAIRLAERMRPVLPGRESALTRLAHFMGEVRSRTRARELPRFHILIAGPAHSGKSAAAHALARQVLGMDYTPIQLDAARAAEDATAMAKPLEKAFDAYDQMPETVGEAARPMQFMVIRVTNRCDEATQEALLGWLRNRATRPYEPSESNTQIIVILDCDGSLLSDEDQIEAAFPGALRARLFKHVWMDPPTTHDHD